MPGEPPGTHPELADWLRPDLAAEQDRETILRYLSSGQMLWARTRMRPCVVCGESYFPLSKSGRTDGLWTWDDDIKHLIREHGLAIPAALHERIARFGGNPPPVDHARIPGLSFPPRWSPEHYFGKPEPGREERWLAQCRGEAGESAAP